MNPYAIEIFTDGSSKVLMGFKAGSGAVVVFPDDACVDPEELFWSYTQSKIGAMEISGINKSIEWLIMKKEFLRKLNINTAIIYCDNDYIVKCANSHVFSWFKNGWKKKNDGSIANLDSWKTFIRLRRNLQGINLEIKWIEGKSNPNTKKADKLAKKGAEASPRIKNYDFMPQKVSDKLTKNLILNVYDGKKSALIRIYFHQLVNTRKDSEVKIYFEEIKYNKVIGCFYAFSSKEFDRAFIDRKNYYNAKFNLSIKNRPLFQKVDKINGDSLIKLKKSIKKLYGRC